MVTTDLELPFDCSEADVRAAVETRLGKFSSALRNITVLRKSIDASDKSNIRAKLTVGLTLDGESEKSLLRRRKYYREAQDLTLTLPNADMGERPVVVGFGPAGIFAALVLAEAGTRPVVLERGQDADRRAETVKKFFDTGLLDPESNIQFGEGGAGAFSDGKLKYGRADKYKMKVLTELAAAGAPGDIVYSANAHVGTDRLPAVIKNIRKKIISLGGEIIFSARVTDIRIENGAVRGVEYIRGGEIRSLACSDLLLAAGHSAQDIFVMLERKGVPMRPKGIGVGVRIEHPQARINKMVYGTETPPPALGAASYHLVTHLSNGRGVYSFCMCPGGSVVASASESDGVVTNGMSPYARDMENGNAAFLVSVSPGDYGGDGPLAGIAFQRKIERRVYSLGGAHSAPVTLMGDFLKGQRTVSLGSVGPTYQRGTFFERPEIYLPDFICGSLKLAIPEFEAWMPGFLLPDAVITGAETRSTCPVEIIRDENRTAAGIIGLYPCGEGSGHAGGIVSSAADGIMSALAVLDNHAAR